MDLLPACMVDVVKVAMPLLKVDVAITVDPFLNVTFPVGFADPDPFTVAVKMIVCP